MSISGNLFKGVDMIANNVLKQVEGKNWVFYKATCSCGDDDCTLTLELGYEEIGNDPEFKEIDLNIYGRIGVYYPSFWEKIKLIWKFLTRGYVESEKTFIFNGKPAIQDFIKALQEGLEKLGSN